jgi:hypothetical protein
VIGRKKVPTSKRSVAGGGSGSYGRSVRQLAVIVVTVSLIAAGGTIAVATGGGGNHGGSHQGNPSHHQYKKKKLCWLVARTSREFESVCEDKPGCGPDKTEGVAGNSGRHTGQPPKRPDRQDCPHAPPQP